MAAKYNIYKIDKEREPELIDNLLTVNLEKVGAKEQDGFKLDFYFSTEPEDIAIWWVQLYKNFIGLDKDYANKAHFGVFLISNDKVCYAVSMGKAYLYLKEFCDLDFGINLAERISSKKFKLKSSKLFGGIKNKNIVSYNINSDMEYDSGESIQYVKAKAASKDKWGGGSVTFGNSVQLHMDIAPEELPTLIKNIEEELTKSARLSIPRATAITDEHKKKELDKKLVDSINQFDSTDVCAAEAEVCGVDFIFLDNFSYSFLYNKSCSDVDGELDINQLRNFILAKGINLFNELDKIKVRLSCENKKPFCKPLKHFLDYVDDANCFLMDGKWYSFNQGYLDYLYAEVDKITFDKDNEVTLSETEFNNWVSSLPEDSKKSAYKEAFFNLKRETEGYENIDRVMMSFGKVCKLEKADLKKDDTLFFVKRGTPQKLSYVIDQSLASLRARQSKELKENFKGVKKFCLWLVLKGRKKEIESPKEIESLIFLMKLAEWQKQCTNARIEPCLRISYEVA